MLISYTEFHLFYFSDNFASFDFFPRDLLKYVRIQGHEFPLA